MLAKKCYIAICLFVLVFASCKKTHLQPVKTLGTDTVDNADIYIAGYVNGTVNGSTAAYWKNGTLVKLTGDGIDSKANALAVSGADIYVAGYVTNAGHNATYWKNGVAVTLSSDASTATGIAVQGSDIYVSGYLEGSPKKAVYWKNGTMVDLSAGDGITESLANAIFVQGSDVYTAGYSSSPAHGTTVTYWKNNTPVFLDAHGAPFSVGFGIAVISQDIYVVGTATSDESQSVCWKNGTEIPISGSADATSVTSDGTNAYVANTGLDNLSYWKNGTLTPLTPNSIDINARVQAIAVVGKNIYLAGQMKNLATCWRNGKAVSIAPAANFSGATAIVVLPRLL